MVKVLHTKQGEGQDFWILCGLCFYKLESALHPKTNHNLPWVFSVSILREGHF